MQYTLPRNLFEELVVKLGQESAEKFAIGIETFLNIIVKETEKTVVEKKEELKAEVYNELRNELATKEFVRAEINEVKNEISDFKVEMTEMKAEIRENNLLLKIVIGISLFAVTIFNPNFVAIVEKIIGK